MGNTTIEYLEEKLRQAEGRLSKKTEQRNKLTAEIAELEERVNVLQSLYNEAESELQIRPIGPSDSGTIIRRRWNKKNKDLSTADYAYMALKEIGDKIHLRDLAKKLIDEGKMNPVKNPEASLHSALSRRKETFELLGNGFWRIRESPFDDRQETRTIYNKDDNTNETDV